MSIILSEDRELEIKKCALEVRNGLNIPHSSPFVSITDIYEKLMAGGIGDFNYQVHSDKDATMPKNIEAYYYDGTVHLRESRWNAAHEYEANRYPDDVRKIRKGQRSRFTLGHELGHVFLHQEHEALMRNQGTRRSLPALDQLDEFNKLMELEAEADYFAGTLLVSQAVIDRYHADGWLHVSHLMKHCKVSRSCARLTINKFSERLYTQYKEQCVFTHQMIKE